MNLAQVQRIIAASPSILLDFDGPICSIFAGITDVVVADRLRVVLESDGVEMDEPTKATNDPLAVLLFAHATAGADTLDKVETALIAAEVEATATATPTPFTAHFIKAAVERGRAVCVVSNNSPEAINAYLKANQLSGYVEAVVGRTKGRADLMKPNPAPITEALRRLVSAPHDAVLIGDSTADVGAAQAAHIPCIGYGNSERARQRLQNADAIIGTMADLLACL